MADEAPKYLSPAKKFIYDNAELLADNILLCEDSFLLGKDMYEEQDKSQIVRALVDLADVENAIPCEEGIKVFVYRGQPCR